MVLAFVLYTLVGGFGFLTFANRPEQFASGNILLADYKGNIGVVIVICDSKILKE
jgi:amino acid permease